MILDVKTLSTPLKKVANESVNKTIVSEPKSAGVSQNHQLDQPDKHDNLNGGIVSKNNSDISPSVIDNGIS